MTSAPAIGFEYRPSRWIARLLVAITLLAILAIMPAGLPWPVRGVLATASVLACARAIRRLRLPIRAAGWSARGGWTLRDASGADEPARLLSSRAWRQAVLLRLASQRHGEFTLWLMPDNSDADIRRRLRMRLPLMRQTATQGD